MLLGNYNVQQKTLGKFMSGTTLSDDRSNFARTGALRNWGKQTGLNWTLAALPFGYTKGWLLPREAGAMASRRGAMLSVSASATAAGGITASGTASLTVTVANAQMFPLDDTPPARTASASFAFTATGVGSLIATASGSAMMTFTVADALLVATIGTSGSAGLTFTTNTPVLGALASGAGSATMTFTVANAQAYPLNDASPLRTGTANFTITGTLQPYAIGHMQGSTVDSSILTSDAIADAVWNSLASQFTDSSTFGGKLNTASSGGVDLTALAQAVRSELATELARLDVRVGTRASQADVFAA